jgi:hypothetical protein
MPQMLNTDEANWGAKAAFLFAGLSLFCTIWCHFRLPESRGRTFEELDILFQRRVPLRKFKNFDLLAEAEGSEPLPETADHKRAEKDAGDVA